MPGKAAKVTVTERQHEILLTLRNATTAPAHLRQRAAVILLAFDGLRNAEIAAQVGLGRFQVGRWRRRWARAWSGLIARECRETKADLRRAIAAVLSDAPRPGAPGKFTPEQVTQILAVACEPPAKSGRPITHWTAHERADEVVKRGIVTSISTSQVSRYLREAALAAPQEPVLAQHHREGPGAVSEAGRDGLRHVLRGTGVGGDPEYPHRLRGRDDGHSGVGADRPDQADDRGEAGADRVRA